MPIALRLLAVSVALLALPLWARQASRPRPPWVPGPARPALRVDAHLMPSPVLQRCLDAAITRLGLQADAREGRFSVAMADLTADPLHPGYAGVADTRMLYGASVPKIATLGAAFQWRRDLRDGVLPRGSGAGAFDQDRLVDAAASAEVRALMGPSAFHNRLRRAVLERWPGAHVYRKTGKWRQFRHDSALVERPGARSAIAALCGAWRCEAEVLAFGREADACAGGGR